MHLQNTVTESTSLKLWNKHILEIVEQYFSSLTNNFLNSDDIFPCMSREKRWQDRRLISSWANGRIEKWFQILINSNFEVLDRSTSLKLFGSLRWSALSAAFVLPLGLCYTRDRQLLSSCTVMLSYSVFQCYSTCSQIILNRHETYFSRLNLKLDGNFVSDIDKYACLH